MGDFSYRVQGTSADFFLKEDGYRVAVPSANNAKKIEDFKDGKSTDNILEYHTYDMKWVGAAIHPKMTGSKAEPYQLNYLLGNNPSKYKAGLRAYLGLAYKAIYPGIDVNISSSGQALKYTYHIAPGSLPQTIKMKYEGAEKLYVLNGQLHIVTSVGEVIEEAPYAFQNTDEGRKEIACEYQVEGNQISFELPEGFDKRLELIIDPTIVFASLTGSSADNWGFSATYDEAGNLYAGGIVAALGYPITTGAFQASYMGGSTGFGIPCDIGISKFAADGSTLIYSTYVGGTLNDFPHSMVMDGTTLVIAGKTWSTDYPVTAGSYDNTANGNSDIFITKLNAAGSALVASTYIGGTGYDGMNVDSVYNYSATSLKFNYGDNSRSEVLVDKLHNVYVASVTRSTNFPTTATAAKSSLTDEQDGVLIKMNPSLSALLYSSYIGGTSADAAYVLVLDTAQTTIYVGGGTQSNNLFSSSTAGALKATYGGGLADGFICKFANSGSYTLQRTTYIGTSAYDQVFGLQTDLENNVYAMGQTLGNYPISPGVFSVAGGKQFVQKLNANLTTSIYSTAWGNSATPLGSRPEIVPIAFLVDTCENVYISGWGGNINGGPGVSGLPVTSDALQSTTDGNDFYFIVLKKNAVSQLYGSFFGAVGKDEHVDGGTSRFNPEGVIYQAICASCGTGSSYPSTPGAWASTKGSLTTNCNLGALKLAFNLGSVKAIASGTPSLDGCAPLLVNFNNLSINGLTYAWNFGDGGTSSTFEPTHTFTAPGVYTVRLIAMNPNSCKERDTTFLTVTVKDDELTPAFTYEVLDSCTAFNVRFTNTSSSTVIAPNPYYTWLFGDGTTYIGIAPPIHSYPGTGTYTVQLIMGDAGACNSPDTTTQIISFGTSLVTANFPPPDSCNAAKTLTFSNSSTNGISYIWRFGDGSSSISTSPSHEYPDFGSYSVTLISSNPATCNKIDSITKTIRLSPSPIASFYFTPLIGEVNVPFNFVNTSTGATTYAWTFGDGASSTELNPIHQYQRTGIFDICLSVTNQFGCTSKICRTLSAEVRPLIEVPSAFTPNGDGSNDRMHPRGFAVQEMIFRIYNRFGELVFEGRSLSDSWDGTYNGKPQPMEAYAYTLSATFIDGSSAKKQGNITLIR